MVGPPVDPASAAAAALKAGPWISEKAAELVRAFRNGKIAFAGKENIPLIREARKTRESSNLTQFVSGSRERALIQSGIALRQVEDDSGRRKRFRDAIHSEFGSKGLHLAQAIQAGIPLWIQQILMEAGLTTKDYESKMRHVLANIDHYVSFIESTASADAEAQTIHTLIRTNHPEVFVVAGKGYAKGDALEVARRLREKVLDYVPSSQTDGRFTVYFPFLRRDIYDKQG